MDGAKDERLIPDKEKESDTTMEIVFLL